MKKHVSFGNKEEVIECDINITYRSFLCKIQEIFSFKEDTFNIVDLTEDNFNEMISTGDQFTIERSEKDLARERLGDMTRFEEIETLQGKEDYLLVYGNMLEPYGNTPLHTAAFYGDVSLVKLIFSKNFDNEHQEDFMNRTPLYWASYRGNIDVVKLLLEKNYDNAHQVTVDNESPIERAKFLGFTEIIKLLEEDIARRNKQEMLDFI